MHGIDDTFRTTQPMVLHVRVVTETGGGPEKTILNSPRYLANLGFACRCAYLHPPQDEGFSAIRRRAEQCSAPLDAVADRGIFDLTVIYRLLRLCKQHEVRIWHGHDYKSNALGVLLSRLWPMRLITTVHGWVRFSSRTPFYYAVDRVSLRFYDRVLCVSPDLYEQCRAAGVRESRCALVENAIDSELFRRITPVQAAKRNLGVPNSRLVIGAIGRLSAEKRVRELVQVFQQLLAQGIDCELWIVGDGDDRAAIETLIRDCGVADRVRLLGYRSDVLELLQAMDVLALYSLREGLPNAILEAMACEVPVVATDVGGIRRAVTHEETGLLVNKDDESGFRAALASVLRDGEKRRALSRAARNTIEQRYSFQRRMQRVAAIYEQLLVHGPNRSRVQSVADS